MNYSDPHHLRVLEPDELHTEQLLRDFFRQHLPEQLPALVFRTASRTPDRLEPSVGQVRQPLSFESFSSPTLSPKTSQRLMARTSYWSHLLLVTAVVLLGWLLLLAPWLAPKPTSTPGPQLDPRDGFARDKPPPISMPKSNSFR